MDTDTGTGTDTDMVWDTMPTNKLKHLGS
jgi:hypothetical protein